MPAECSIAQVQQFLLDAVNLPWLQTRRRPSFRDKWLAIPLLNTYHHIATT